jgi:hypothetical protein
LSVRSFCCSCESWCRWTVEEPPSNPIAYVKIDLDVFGAFTELNGFCLHVDGVKDIKRTRYV